MSATKKRKATTQDAAAGDGDYDRAALIKMKGAEYESLQAIFPELLQSFIAFLRDDYQMSPSILARTERMIKYNVLGGKLNRGIMVLYAMEDLCKNQNIPASADRTRKAQVMAWCIEILQAEFLVADDIMDGSITRRGQPCWYKNPEIGLDASNDAMLLDSFLYFLLEHELQSEGARYVTIVQLFWDVSMRTKMGQMMDLINQPQGREAPKDMIDHFTLELYQKIVRFKTAYYTFYLPLACGMLLCGFDKPAQLKVAKDTCVVLGEKFQIQDDYLDCYGDPKQIGKVGTDIQDHKCSWLVVQFMKIATPEQLAKLKQHYGKHSEESIAIVKQLYNDVDLPKLYAEQEATSKQQVLDNMKKHNDTLPSVVFDRILAKIHGRQK